MHLSPLLIFICMLSLLTNHNHECNSFWVQWVLLVNHQAWEWSWKPQWRQMHRQIGNKITNKLTVLQNSHLPILSIDIQPRALKNTLYQTFKLTLKFISGLWWSSQTSTASFQIKFNQSTYFSHFSIILHFTLEHSSFYRIKTRRNFILNKLFFLKTYLKLQSSSLKSTWNSDSNFNIGHVNMSYAVAWL